MILGAGSLQSAVSIRTSRRGCSPATLCVRFTALIPFFGMADGTGDTLPEQFRLLVQETEEYAIFLLDSEGRVRSWNAGARNVKGYSEGEILGEHLSVFYRSEDVEAGLPERALRAAREQGQWVNEGWRVRSDGSRFWARVTIAPLRQKGTLRGFATLTRDLTDQRQKKEAERARERADRETRLLRLMETAASTANQAEDLTQAVEETVAAVCKHLGWPVGHAYWVRPMPSRLTSSPIWYVEDEHYERIRERSAFTDVEIKETLAGQVVEQDKVIWIGDVRDDARFVRTMQTDDLKVRGAVGVPVRVDGEVVAVLEFFSSEGEEGDPGLEEALRSVALQLSHVARRQRSQQSMKESEEMFRALAQQSLVGIALIQDGRYEYVNPTLADYFGCDQADMIGRSPEAFYHPEDWPRINEEIQQRLSGETGAGHYTARGRTRAGDVVYLELYGQTIEYRGRPAVVGAALDVTEAQRLEEKLLEVQDQERQRLSQELHDGLGSLLTAAGIKVSSLVQRAKAGEHIDPKDLRKANEYIREAGEEARSIAHGLSPIALEHGLGSALDRLADRTEARGDLECRVKMSDVPGELSEKVTTHLYRIAQESLNNVLKHADADCVRLALEGVTEEVEEARALTLTIEDDGCGLSGDDPESGLGMQTMRRRANRLGGTLTVETSVEGGLRIECRIPAVETEDRLESEETL